MANEPKTAGQVDHAAFQQAQCEWLSTRVRSWEEETPGIQNCHEAAAQAVRLQLRRELDAEIGIVAAEPGKVMKLIGEIAVEDIVRVAAIRRLLTEYSVDLDPDHREDKKDDLIAAIETVLDEPKPEEAEACAEPAGAEQSKSPPPAER